MKKIILTLKTLLISAALSAQAVVYVNASATGTNSGGSWQNAYTNLDSALIKSNSNEEIWVAKGTYKPGDGTNRNASFVVNRAIYGGFAGTESSREERNIKANPTILSGDLSGDDNANINTNEASRSENSYSVVTYKGGILSGFVVEGGNANGSGIARSSAAGIYAYGNFNGKITDCILRNNSAIYHTAIRFHRPGGLNSWLTIDRCEFYNNRSKSGVIGFLGGGTHGTYLHVYNSLFHHNTITEANSALIPLALTNMGTTVQGALHFEFIHNTLSDNNYSTTGYPLSYTKRGNSGVAFHNALIYNNIFADSVLPFKERIFPENVANSSFQFVYNVYAFDALESPSSEAPQVYFNVENFSKIEFKSTNNYHLKNCASKPHFTGSYIKDNQASFFDIEGNKRDSIIVDAGCYMITGIPKVTIERDDNTLKVPSTHTDGYWFVDSTGGRPALLSKGDAIRPHKRGIYGLIAQDTASKCYSSSNAYSFFYTDIDKLNINKMISLFPNPASHLFKFSNEFKGGMVTITNAIGKVLFHKMVKANEYIDVSSFAVGLYTVTIQSAQTIVQIKLIKQ